MHVDVGGAEEDECEDWDSFDDDWAMEELVEPTPTRPVADEGSKAARRFLDSPNHSFDDETEEWTPYAGSSVGWTFLSDTRFVPLKKGSRLPEGWHPIDGRSQEALEAELPAWKLSPHKPLRVHYPDGEHSGHADARRAPATNRAPKQGRRR